jgi:hypothetical protein
MDNSLFNTTPLSLLLVATVGFVLLAVEIGFRIGVRRVQRSAEERQAPIDAMVSSVLGLLAFLLAFTFGMATSRFDTRKQMVIDDAIAIRAADLRAQLLPEPHRDEIRTLLREYVDIRIQAARTPHDLPRLLERADELQDQLWVHAATVGEQTASVPVAAFAQALVQMMDLHSKRVAADLHNRIPATIWIALYCVTGLAMAMMGYRSGIAERRSLVATLTLVLAYSVVILLIADLDRQQEGFLRVSQQSMVDLQTRLHGRTGTLN